VSNKIHERYRLLYNSDKDMDTLRVRPSTSRRFAPDCNVTNVGERKITYFSPRASGSNKYVTYEQFKRIYERAAIPQVTQFLGRADEATANAQTSNPNQRQWGRKALDKLRALQNQKPSMESFIEMLDRPENLRPTNFAQCVDFFYPESGILAIEGDNSPFIGTLPFQYEVDPNQLQNAVGDIPLQLGEITMMYGWFIIFRQLLCQKNPEVSSAQIPPSPEQVFEHVGESGFLLEADKLRGVQAQVKNKIDKLITISQAVGYADRLAKTTLKLGTEHNWDFGDFLDSQDYADLANEFSTKGVTLVASSISSQIGLPSKYANDIATFIVDGKLDKKRFEDLVNKVTNLPSLALSKAQRASKEAYDTLKGLIEKQASSAIAGPNPETYKRSPIFNYSGAFVPILATKDPSKLEKLRQDLEPLREEGPAGEELYKRSIQFVEQELEADRSRFKGNFVDTMPSRENPASLAVTAALVGADIAFNLIQGGLEYKAQRQVQRLEAMRNYLYTNVFRLNESLLTGLPYDFSFFTHVRSGLRSARIPPTCELQQGGQMLDYWTSTISGLRVPITNMRNAVTTPSARKGKAEADVLQDAFLVSNVAAVVPYIKMYEQRDGDRKKVCAGMRYLAQNSVGSVMKVLQTLPYFSPFTHAFGFAPVFNQPSNDFISFIDGMSARTYLGPANVTSWATGQASAPYRTNFYTYDGTQSEGEIPQNAAVTEEEVECWVGVTPMPSRRTLEGKFGGRASVSFDTAFGATPVMDAQYCALMSVLFMYKEARDTIRNSSLSWRNKLPLEDVKLEDVKLEDTGLSQYLVNLINQKKVSPHLLDLINRRKFVYYPELLNHLRMFRVPEDYIKLESLQSQRQVRTPAQMFVRTLAVSGAISALVYGGWKWRNSRKAHRDA
jgi:hypothetical protein